MSRWPSVRLGAILKVQNGFAFNSSLFIDEPESVPIIRIRDLARGFSQTYYLGPYSDKYVVNHGDFLIGMDGEFRCYVWPGPPALLNQRVCRLQDFAPDVVPKFIYYAINEHLSAIEANTSYSTVKHISSSQIEEISLSLPSKSEQTRIVWILDEAERMRRFRDDADRHTLDLIPAMFQELFGNSALSYPVEKLGNLGSLDRGKSKHRPRNEPSLFGGSYPFVQTGDIANCGGIVEGYSQTYSELGLAQSKLWPKGTLCITIAANIAKTAVLTFPACFPDSIVGFIPEKQVTIEYIRAWLEMVAAKIEEDAPQAAQKNINLQILRNLDVPVPPHDLQHEFSGRVKEVYAMKEAQTAARCRLDNLFQSLLHRAFQGEL